MAQMVAAIEHLHKEMGILKAKPKAVSFSTVTPLGAGAKGKFKGSPEGDEEEDLEGSVAPGEDSVLEGGTGLPQPIFKAEATTTAGSSSSSSSSTAGNKTDNVCVVATTYPAAWSTYLTPVGPKGSGSGTKGGAKGVSPSIAKVSIRPVPSFSGAEGEDVQLWLEKIKLRGAQAGWDTTTLLSQASAALEGAAALWLHTASPDVMFLFD